MKRIGVFAGAFDPIHLGHTDFIRRSVAENQLDKIYILIEKTPRFKKVYAAYEHRKKMVELAIKEIPQAEIFPSSTDDFPISSTLPIIKSNNKPAKFYLMIGNDVAKHISNWPEADGLLEGVQLVVVERAADQKNAGISSGKVRDKLADNNTSTDIDARVLGYCKANNLYETRS